MLRLQLMTAALATVIACGGPDRPRKKVNGDPSGHTIGAGDSDAPGDGGDSSTGGPSCATGGLQLNPGWVGGACGSVADCSSTAFDQAPICVDTGFPGGLCTQACTQSSTNPAHWLCPDEDFQNPGTMFSVTRCIDAAGSPRCVSECNFDKSPTGCRSGYACVMRERYSESFLRYPVCLPCDSQRWPGESLPGFDIGAACNGDGDCNHLRCLELGGGYCSKTMCELSGCPAGSECFSFETSEVTACLRSCTASTQCREGEGYVCLNDYGACWPDTTAPTWDNTVGPADCAAAWGNGLSPCDSTPDDYIVVDKAARNLALCNQGSEVQSFNVGLGFTPTGDKTQQGDGKTPEGVFYIPRIVDPSQYYKAFLVSYPDSLDATRGVAAGLIDAATQTAIDSAQSGCTEPPQNTQLGGLIEVHGNGGGQDWTWGCIAVANAEIDTLMAALEVHDTIVILP